MNPISGYHQPRLIGKRQLLALTSALSRSAIGHWLVQAIAVYRLTVVDDIQILDSYVRCVVFLLFGCVCFVRNIEILDAQICMTFCMLCNCISQSLTHDISRRCLFEEHGLFWPQTRAGTVIKLKAEQNSRNLGVGLTGRKIFDEYLISLKSMTCSIWPHLLVWSYDL